MIFKPINIIIFLCILATCNCALTLIKDFIQFNVAGHPILHKETNWPFDPEVGVRRSRQYQELNGKFGEKAIERLGLGIDGYDQERLEAQKMRDKGHLNGLDDLQIKV